MLGVKNVSSSARKVWCSIEKKREEKKDKVTHQVCGKRTMGVATSIIRVLGFQRKSIAVS